LDWYPKLVIGDIISLKVPKSGGKLWRAIIINYWRLLNI